MLDQVVLARPTLFTRSLTYQRHIIDQSPKELNSLANLLTDIPGQNQNLLCKLCGTLVVSINSPLHKNLLGTPGQGAMPSSLFPYSGQPTRPLADFSLSPQPRMMDANINEKAVFGIKALAMAKATTLSLVSRRTCIYRQASHPSSLDLDLLLEMNIRLTTHITRSRRIGLNPSSSSAQPPSIILPT